MIDTTTGTETACALKTMIQNIGHGTLLSWETDPTPNSDEFLELEYTYRPLGEQITKISRYPFDSQDSLDKTIEILERIYPEGRK